MADAAKRAHFIMKRMLHHIREVFQESPRQQHLPELLVRVSFSWVQAKVADYALDELPDQRMVSGDCVTKFKKCF